MHPPSSSLSRRALLQRMGFGLGGLALADMLTTDVAASQGGLPGLPHFAPKAKRVIFLFMSGGPSQFETFDYKPELVKRHNQDLPESCRKGMPLPGMSGSQSAFPLVRPVYEFKQHGQSGAWVSEIFPHMAKVADDLTFIKTMSSDAVNHDPALTFMQTGDMNAGRPSIGSWVSYGLGSDNRNLPNFVVLISKRMVDQPLSGRLWDSAFLPSHHQGAQFRAGREPVLYLNEPPGLSSQSTRRMLDTLKEMHEHLVAGTPDSGINSRIEQYEMAYRMQRSVPEATDLSHEPDHIFDLYGPDARKPGSFAANCLLARRLAERDVKFIQLYHPGWDHHGHLPRDFPVSAREVDQPCAALIQDLKQRDLLKDTLVIWGGEFGRTCYSQGAAAANGINPTFGRDHHRACFTFWMAGGGMKPGITHGETDEFGFSAAKDPVTVNDFHSTLLHLLGVNHERLTYRFQGRDFRLTDVGGKVIKSLLA